MNTSAAPLLLALVLVFPCGAQNPPATGPEPPEAEEPSGIFPLSLVLEALQGPRPRLWRPDWPPEIPPDAFEAEGAAAVLVELGEAGGGEEGEYSGPLLDRYRLAWDSRGRPAELPLALPAAGPAGDPLFVQARLRYEGEEGLASLDLEIPGPDSPSGTLRIRFEEPYLPGSLPPLRVEYGDRLYHVRFHAGIHEITETWFDPRGIFLAYFKTRIESPEEGSPAWRILGLEGAEYGRDESGWGPKESGVYRLSFFYESGGNLSERAGPGGSFSAIYGERPLYWSRASRQFSLQWDQGGRLVRLRDLGGDGPSPVDFRYEYEFDSRGNWILRREIALYRAGNLLLPAYGRDLVRRVLYAGDVSADDLSAGGEEGNGGLD
jgi:hypothetical protein